MISFEDILAGWEKDCVIDQVELDESSIRFARIHSKYLNLLTESKLIGKRLTSKFDVLKRDKWMYYHGKMTREQIDSRGWKYDPFEGASKPLKSDMNMFIDTDLDVQRLSEQIEYQKTITEAIEEIMGTLRWRHSAIKNIIDFRKFTSGA